MADVVSPETRSRMMARIGPKDSDIELFIRRALHARGYRFRLHARNLPGRPDILFPRYRAVIQVHGCFWHQHDCSLFRLPSTNTDLWKTKLDENRARDLRTKAQLESLGWRVLEIWECSIRNQTKEGQGQVINQTAAWLNSYACSAAISGASLSETAILTIT